MPGPSRLLTSLTVAAREFGLSRECGPDEPCRRGASPPKSLRPGRAARHARPEPAAAHRAERHRPPGARGGSAGARRVPRRGATSGGTDLLPAVLHRASGASARPGDGAGEAELLLGHLLGPRRRAIETALARRVALDPCSAHRVLTAVVAKLLESLGDGTLGSRWDARELCREIGTALARGEDAVPGAIGTFEELLADGATEEDCVHLGAVLVGSLAAQACG